MRRRVGERGTALLWGVILALLVSFAVAMVAGALARQARAVRRLQAEAARADLERAAQAWLREVRTEVHLELAGGSFKVVREPDGALATRVRLRSEPRAQ